MAKNTSGTDLLTLAMRRAHADTAERRGAAAHDDAIAEILATVQATAARIDALQDGPGPARETAKELARETATLAQAVANARGGARQGGRTSRAGRTGRRRQRAPWPGPPPR